MDSYRVTIDTLHECYVYEVDAENDFYAEIVATNLARDAGWNGGGLPKITVENLSE